MPLKRGSTGVGFCLKRGVKTTVTYSKRENNLAIFINNKKVSDAAVSQIVVNHFINIATKKYPNLDLQDFFSHLTIKHKIFLPLSSGFGTSAAGALSLAFALNKMLCLNLPKVELAQITHLCELEAKTGLGTVAGTAKGGMEYRESSGAPGVASILDINYPKKLKAHIFYYGSFPTPLALSDKALKEQIKKAGNKAIDIFKSNPNWQEAQKLSTIFTKESGLLPSSLTSLFDFLETSQLYPAMLLFGNGLYFLYQPKEQKKIKKAVKRIRKMNYNVVKEFDLYLDPKGARYEF